MNQTSYMDALPILSITLLAVAAILVASYYRRAHRPSTLAGSSVLLAYYLNTAKLTSTSGVLDDTYYTMFISTIKEGIDRDNVGIFHVELPFYTSIHLLGIPKRSGATPLDPTGKNSRMEKVDLEGNFRKYFALYAEKGNQAQARYVLDPAAMAFVVDFCQSHNWEIIGNSLYFAQAEFTGSSKDTTFMSEDIQRFIKEIRPAVEDADKAVHGTIFTPYGQDRRDTLRCLVCGDLMENKADYFICPNSHGVLLTGASLIKLRSGSLRIVAAADAHIQSTATKRTCPSCESDMSRVDYNHTGVIIDSCTRCPYRWLDLSEITQIAKLG